MIKTSSLLSHGFRQSHHRRSSPQRRVMATPACRLGRAPGSLGGVPIPCGTSPRRQGSDRVEPCGSGDQPPAPAPAASPDAAPAAKLAPPPSSHTRTTMSPKSKAETLYSVVSHTRSVFPPTYTGKAASQPGTELLAS
jgi:hypothetical protein